jgi:tRNA nucleotidyltransferase (CCA-adding enzyme)
MNEMTTSIWTTIEAAYPGRVARLLVEIGALAERRGEGAYLVGGAVRDALLGRAARADIDIAVEGRAESLAADAARALNAKLTVHKSFGTATIEFDGGQHIDFAMARKETYAKPGALPKVSPAKSIHDDLARRDFTINAMAVRLNEADRGRLVDPHGGREDLANGLLRVIHENSFIDDPTRMLRGVRFRNRFDFAFEHRTLSLLHAALEDCALHRVSGARVRKEIQAAMEETEYVSIIKELNALDIDGGALAPGLNLHTELLEPENRIEASAAALSQYARPPDMSMWTLRLLAAAFGASDETLESLARRLALPRRHAAPFLNPLVYAPRARAPLNDPELEPAGADDILAAAEPETLALLHAADMHGAARAHIERFLNADIVTLEITGGDLLAMGHDPSPLLGRVLREVRRAKIEGKVATRKQELALARKLLNTWD